MQFFEDPVSPTIDATVRLQPRCSEKTDPDSGEPSYTTRLLVSTSRIGCLIGKGGSIITEIRRTSRANIRIFSKENVPKVASEDEEMVQVTILTSDVFHFHDSLSLEQIFTVAIVMYFRSVETLRLQDMLLCK